MIEEEALPLRVVLFFLNYDLVLQDLSATGLAGVTSVVGHH